MTYLIWQPKWSINGILYSSTTNMQTLCWCFKFDYQNGAMLELVSLATNFFIGVVSHFLDKNVFCAEVCEFGNKNGLLFQIEKDWRTIM